MENYQKVELWKQRGFISDEMNVDMQINLANNLQYTKDIIMCKKILSDDFDFYHNVELLLYPIVVYYTKIKNTMVYNDKSIIHLFDEFCQKNLKIKVNYNLDKYNDDYLLVTDFINAHS